MPLEINHVSQRVVAFEPGINGEGMKLALDLIDEIRDETNARIVEHQNKASFNYNLRVKERFFY